LPVSYESAKACAVVVDNSEQNGDAVAARSGAVPGGLHPPPEDLPKEYSVASSSSSPSVLGKTILHQSTKSIPGITQYY